MPIVNFIQQRRLRIYHNTKLRPKRIYTDRRQVDSLSQQIVYEWEDELAAALNLKIANSPVPKNRSEVDSNLVYTTFKKYDYKLFKGRFNYILKQLPILVSTHFFYFEMYPKFHPSFSNGKKGIPIIIDFWARDRVELFNAAYRQCPLILVTSLEVLEFLKENDCRSRLIYSPVSLPTKYKLGSSQSFEKKYDIVLAGRVNIVLLSFLKKYEIMHPEIEYLSQILINGEVHYKSNKRGVMGRFNSRSQYISLIRSGRVSFYSTPGIDEEKSRTNGFNPVTPRFLELLSAGCHILARYPNTIETSYFGLDAICPSINTYQEFEFQLDNALNLPQPIKRNSEYLKDHYTSNRINDLRSLFGI